MTPGATSEPRPGGTPASSPVTSRDDVAEHVQSQLVLGAPGTIGAELEWFAFDAQTPGVRPSLQRVHAALEALSLPGGASLSTEPGGQVELSSLPHRGPQPAVTALAQDLTAVREALLADGIVLYGGGTDPSRPAKRLLDTSRYACMDAYFAAAGGEAAEAGLSMMCSTAAVQVSIDAGLPGTGLQSVTERWQRAHAIGPALVAAFACSPVLSGHRTGWASTRQLIWERTDPSRTRAPRPHLGPVEAVTELAWDARLLLLHEADGTCVPAPPITFAEWVEGALDAPPTVADLTYHLSTLFPPVRARGWYEVRYIDGLPDPLWQVAVAVVAALLDDDTAAEAARVACEPVEQHWAQAARHGMADPELARAAQACLTAAAEALPRLGAPALAGPVEEFLDRYTARGLSPAAAVPAGEALTGEALTGEASAQRVGMIA